MIRLNTTTRSLQVVLSGAVTTNQLPCMVSYSDKTSTTYLGATSVANTNGTTAVTIAAAPVASTIRDIDTIVIQNRDTVSATVTLRYNDNATTYDIVKVTLSSGDQLVYAHGEGFSVLDLAGNTKSGYAQLAVASGKVLTVLNSLTLQGTDGVVLTLPTASGTLAKVGTGILDAPTNSQLGTAAYLDANTLLQTSSPVTTTAANYVVGAEVWLIVNYAGTHTVTLPSASAYAGRMLVVKTVTANTVVSASSNVVPLVGGAAGTAILAATAGKYAKMISDGTNWVVMEAN